MKHTNNRDLFIALLFLFSIFLMGQLAACTPGLNFKEVTWKGPDHYSARDKVAGETKLSEAQLLQQGYVQIGELSVGNVKGKNYDKDSKGRLLEQAAAWGGDLVRFSSVNFESSGVQESRFCGSTTTIGTGIARRTICIEEKVARLNYTVTSSGGFVWRHEPALAQRQRFGKQFCQALQKNDLQAVKSIASKGLDLNVKYCGRHPLEYAVGHSNSDMFQYFVNRGAKPGAIKYIWNLVPRDGNPEIVAALLKSGIKADHLIGHVISAGNLKSAHIVREHGATIKPAHLARALRSGIDRMVDFVLERIDPKSIPDTKPLISAAANGGPAMLKRVKGWGVDLNQKNKKNENIAYNAAVRAKPTRMDSFIFLLKENIQEDTNRLLISATWYSPEATSILLKRGADPNAVVYKKTRLGSLADAHKVTEARVKNAELLLSAGGDPNRLDENGMAPLHYAADKSEQGHLKMARVLLKGGANPNLKNQKQMTPLATAVLGYLRNEGYKSTFPEGKERNRLYKKAYFTMVEILLKGGADPNKNPIRGSGWFPLHMMVIKGDGHLKMTRLLLKYKADPKLTVKCSRGFPKKYSGQPCNALDLALGRPGLVKYSTKTIKLLRGTGATPITVK